MKKYRNTIFIMFSLLLVCSFSFAYSESRPLPHKARIQNENSKKIKETIIRIPDSEMQYIIDKEKEGIFIPFKDYRSLYQKAKEAFCATMNERGGEEEGPSITQAAYQASITGNIISFSATYQIVQTHKDPALLRFPLTGVLYRKAWLHGERVQLYHKDNSPRLVIPGAGSYELLVEFDVPIDFKEKKGCVTFTIPPVLFGEVRILSDLFYDVMLKDIAFAAKRKIGHQFETIGFIGNRDKISLEINNRRSFGEKGVKVFSHEKHEVYLSRELIETFSTYILNVREGEIKSLEMQMPRDLHIHELSGQGIAGWRRESGGTHDCVKIDFYVPVSAESTFQLRTYNYVSNESHTYTYHDFPILNLFDRTGELFIYYAKDIRMRVEEAEYIMPMSIEPSRIPASRFDAYQLGKSYRLVNLPFTLGASFADAPSGIQSVIHHSMSLEPFKLGLTSTLSLSGFKKATVQFSFSFPETLIPTHVSASVNGYTVQEFHEVDKEKRLLHIEIRKPVCSGDSVVFTIASESFLDEALLRKSPLEMKIPTIFYGDAESTQGELHVSIHKAFLLEDLSMKGFSPSQDMLYGTSRIDGDKKVLCYNFRSDTAEGLIKFSLRRAELVSEITNYITIDEDIMQVTSFLRYTIAHGATNSFYFAIPFWKNYKINITGDKIKEKKIVAIKDVTNELNEDSLPDLEGFEIWNVVCQSQMGGVYDLTIDFQKVIDTSGTFFDVPLIMPLGVKNDSGFIVIEASKTTHISVKKTGLNEVESYELPKWTSYKTSNRIIESNRYFTQPFTFQLCVRKREGLPVLSAVVERENILYSLGRDADIFFEYGYSIKNTNLQFLTIKLPHNHILWGATLQGKGIKPRKGNGGDLLIPLPAESDKALNLNLIGNIPDDTTFFPVHGVRFHPALLPIPCLHSTMQVYFPKEYAIVGIEGVFDRYPDWIFDTPLIMSLWKRMKETMKSPGWRFHPLGGLKAQKELSKPSICDKGGGEQILLEREEDVQSLKKEKKIRRSPEKRNFAVKGQARDEDYEQEALEQEPSLEVAPQKVPSGIVHPQAPAPKTKATGAYSKKKGILSLEFHIPTQGKDLSMSKLWGDNYLTVLFLSSEGKRILALLNFFVFIALGALFYKKKIINPTVFTLTSVVIFTLLPSLGLKGWTFLFNSAVFGSVCFLLVVALKDLFIKCRNHVMPFFIFILLCGSWCMFNTTVVLCKDTTMFPDVEVYIPYDLSSPLTINNDAQVYIPTEDYFDLKFLAEPPYKPENDFQYENEYDITAMQARGMVEDDRVVFNVRMDIFMNHEQWVLAQLPFQGAVIESMKLDGGEIPVKIKAHAGLRSFHDIYEIPIFGKGGHALELVFHVNIETLLGKKTINFNFPATLCADWQLEIMQKDIVFDSDSHGAGYAIEETDKGFVIKISPSLQNHIHLSWFPKKFIRETEKPLIYTECELNLFVDYDHVLIEESVAIQVEKSSIVSFSFLKNPGVTVLDIFSDKVKSWNIKKRGDDAFVDVVFKHEITDRIELMIKGRLKTKPGEMIPHLFFQPIGAKRVHGFLTIYCTPDFHLKVLNSENLRVSELRHTKDRENFLLTKSYSFLTDAFKAELLCLPYDTSARADLFTHYRISENVVYAQVSGTIHMKEGYLTHMALYAPSGYRLQSVEAQGVSDPIFNKDQQHIILSFIHGLRGDFPFTMKFEKEITLDELIDIEGFELLDVNISHGAMSVVFPREYEVRESEIVNLQSVAFETVSNNYTNELAQYDGAQYAYAFKEGTYKASYTISRKKALLDVVKVNCVRVEDNLVNVRLLSIFDIKNAPVEHFIMNVPVDLKDSLTIQGEGIKTILKKEDTENKNVLITVHMVSGIDQSYMMEISYNKYFGQDKLFTLPQIIFPQVTSPMEFISVETATSYQIDSKPSGKLMEIDRALIPAFPVGINLHHVLWSYRCGQTRDWEYTIMLKRLEREKLIEAKILRQDIKSVVIPQGVIIHTVRFRVRNKSLQFLPIDFPSDAEIWSLWVAGEPVRPSFTDVNDDNKKKHLLIPLIKSGSGDRDFEIKLMYQSKVSAWGIHGSQSLNMIGTGDLAIEKTTWTLFLPRHYSYMSFTHNMNEADLTMIESDKAYELAKEHAYWRKMADSSKGEMRNKAIENIEKVFNEYQTQQNVAKNLQGDIQRRIKGPDADQKLLGQAQQYNASVLNQAEEMIRSSKAQEKQRYIKEKEPEEGRQAVRERAQVKGWQFNTTDIPAQHDVQTSINNYMRVEQDRLRKQEYKRRNLQDDYNLPVREEKEIGRMMDQDKVARSIIMPQSAGKPFPEEVSKNKSSTLEVLKEEAPAFEVSKDDALKVTSFSEEDTKSSEKVMRQSILLKGMRSMDITFPEQGIPFSFQKLGGNPHLVFSYGKKNTLMRFFYGLLLIAVLGIAVRFREWAFPAERLADFYEEKNLSDYYYLIIESKLIKAAPTLMMILSLLIGGPPLLIAGFGLNTILLLRYISSKRYEKKGVIPSFSVTIFLKYVLSYLILMQTMFMIFYPPLFLCLLITTALNTLLVIIYAIVMLLTKTVIPDEELDHYDEEEFTEEGDLSEETPPDETEP
ncbi:MAG: hypothetical protein ACMUIP_00480 [bacterium]